MEAKFFTGGILQDSLEVKPEAQVSQTFLSDDSLEELKHQSSFSCLLCALDELDSEDWE